MFSTIRKIIFVSTLRICLMSCLHLELLPFCRVTDATRLLGETWYVPNTGAMKVTKTKPEPKCRISIKALEAPAEKSV